MQRSKLWRHGLRVEERVFQMPHKEGHHRLHIVFSVPSITHSHEDIPGGRTAFSCAASIDNSGCKLQVHVPIELSTLDASYKLVYERWVQFRCTNFIFLHGCSLQLSTTQRIVSRNTYLRAGTMPNRALRAPRKQCMLIV